MNHRQLAAGPVGLDRELVRAQAPLAERVLHDEENGTVRRIVAASRNAPERAAVHEARRSVERRMNMPFADVLDRPVRAGNFAVKNSLQEDLVAEEEVPSANRSRSGAGRDRDLESAFTRVASDEDAASFGLGRRAYASGDG